MGLFATSEHVKARSRLEEIRAMEAEDIEDLLIIPAERRLEEEFALALATDGDPGHLGRRFDDNPKLRTRFQRDAKICVVLLCDRMETNPGGFANQSVRSSTVSFGKRMPEEVRTLMRQWSGPSQRRLRRV